jgi:hypothetical protein
VVVHQADANAAGCWDECLLCSCCCAGAQHAGVEPGLDGAGAAARSARPEAAGNWAEDVEKVDLQLACLMRCCVTWCQQPGCWLTPHACDGSRYFAAGRRMHCSRCLILLMPAILLAFQCLVPWWIWCLGASGDCVVLCLPACGKGQRDLLDHLGHLCALCSCAILLEGHQLVLATRCFLCCAGT